MTTDTEITYELVDATAAADGAPAAPDRQPWSDPTALHNHTDGRTDTKWGTLEDGGLLLDGSFTLFPEDPSAADMGLWSASLSDADGVFAAPPVLTVAFSAPHTSIGVTLTFAEPTGDFCCDLHLDWYGAEDALLASQDFSPDSAVYFCEKQVENYEKLVFTFRRTNRPHHYLKLFRVDYGLVEQLRGRRITAASLLEEIDPAGLTVSVNTLRFGFHADRRFDLLALTGAYAAFQQQQRVYVRQRVDGVLRQLGLFFTDAPTVEDEHRVTVDCIDWVGVIEQTDYLGGLWPDGIAAGALLADILSSAGMAADEYEIDPTLAGALVRGYLPICTHRQALQQLAFAIGGMVSCARSRKLRVLPAPTVPTGTIKPRDKAAGHRQTQRAYVSGVEIYVHDYALSGGTTQLFAGDCAAGERLVQFAQPAANLSCSGAAIAESGVNYARLTIETPGTVTLTGTAYEDQTSLGGSVYAAKLPVGARANVKTVEDATLVADAQAAAQRLFDAYQRRVEDTGDLFPVFVAPGDCVTLETAGGQPLTALLESLDTDLTGGGIAKAVLAGGAT